MVTSASEKIKILYSDPPWGDGNMNYWVTMNKKMTGRECAPLTYDQLLAALFQLIKRVDGHVFIETGKRWGGILAKSFELDGLHNIRRFTLRYKSGSKWLENELVFGGTAPHHKFEGFDPTPLSGADTAQCIVDHIKTPGGIVLDPCCGMGYTARAAVAAGMVFYGNEFNAKRLEKTIKFLTAA